MSEDAVVQVFAQYAFRPGFVYGAIAFMMLISSFGFPVPEEITLVSAGLVCYMGSRPDLFPPPFEGAPVVNTHVAAAVAFFSVVGSDFIVYFLGRKYGTRFLRSRFMARYSAKMDKVAKWTTDFGAWAAGIFRFTPGLRFPGHFACGALGLSAGVFLLVDGAAALISVPTQVYLVATFGEHILVYFNQFKLVFFGLIAVALVVYVGHRLWKRQRGAPN